MSVFIIWAAAWLAENSGGIAVKIGLRVLGEYLLRKALLLRKRIPPKAFVTPDEYFKPYLSNASKSLIRHDLKLVERENDVVTLTQGITSLKWPVVILAGAPGQGKSRFSLELARSIGKDRRTILEKMFSRSRKWKVYFVNTNMIDVLAHVSELPRRNPLVLFVDDAANSPQLARSLAEYAAANTDDMPLVLVFTSRIYLLPTIQDAMPTAFLGRVHSFRLNRLSVDGIGKIYDELAPNISSIERNRFIQFTKDSPFLTVLLCDAIRSGVPLAAQLSDDQMRRRLCDEPIEKAISQCGIAMPNVRVALAGICAAAPYDGRNAKLREAVKELANLNDAEFDCIIRASLDSGLFIEYGAARIRPAPDLVGDLILDRVLISEAGGDPSAIAENMMEALLPIVPERIISNMADLGWTNANASVDLIRPVLQSYKEQVTLLSSSEIYALLDSLKPIAFRRPEAVLDIVEALWARLLALAPISDASMGEWRRLLGDAMPVIEGAAYTESGLLRAMNLVKEFYTHAGVDTVYDNHKPLTVLIEIVGFSPFRSLSLNELAMTELERWFVRGGVDGVVALEALDQVLASTVNWTESRAVSLTFSSRVLSLNDKVIAIRERAVSLVERGILSPDPKLCMQALTAVDALGRYRSGAGFALDSEIAMQIQKEKLLLSKAIEKALKAGATYRVMRNIEKCLWNWWCFSDALVGSRSAELLRLIPSEPSYQISKGIYGTDVPLETVVPSPAEIGSKSHVEYFIHEGRDEFTVENVESVIQRLKISDTASDWAAFLRTLAVGEGSTSWRARTVFEAIARRAPIAAVSLAVGYQGEPWSNDRIVLLSTVREIDYSLWSANLQLALQDSQLSEDLAFTWLASFGGKSAYDALQVAFFDKCLAMGSGRLRKLAVECLSHGNVFGWDETIRRLLQIAGTMPNDIEVLDSVFSKLAHNRARASIAKVIGETDKEALRYLLSLSLNDVPWDKPYWVGDYFKFVAEHYPVDFLRFLSGSLTQLPVSSKFHFRILGARNAEEPIKVLLAGPLRRVHLNALFELASEEGASGEFVRAVFRKVLPINDPDLRRRIEKSLSDGEAVKAAFVLSGYHFSLDWLKLCKETVIAADRLNLEDFEKATSELQSSFWEGTTSRTIGHVSERDQQVSSSCAELIGDAGLSLRCREFFRRAKGFADQSIKRDLESDEEILESPLQR